MISLEPKPMLVKIRKQGILWVMIFAYAYAVIAQGPIFEIWDISNFNSIAVNSGQ